MVSGFADILTIGACKPPSWAGKNLNYWYCHEISQDGVTPGHLWLNRRGVFFDPRKVLPPNTYPARTKWSNLQNVERQGRSLTVTFHKWNKPMTHTFLMPRLRARRAEQHILAQYEAEPDSE